VARRAELNPVVAVDWLVLAVGGLAIGVLVAVGAALPAWRAAGVRGHALGVIDATVPRRPSRAAAALAAAGVPPTAVIGVRLALEPGRGRTAVPVRAALAGAVAAVCAITAAAGFGASLTRLVSTPPAYGVAWDVAVGGFAPTAAAEPVAGQLLANPEVAAVAALLGQSEVTVDGRLVPILAIEERKGALAPVVIEGREPLRPDEIALGSLTLRSLGRRVGDTVTLAAERRPARPLRVVGRVVLNQPGCDCVITQGKGGIVHPDLFRDLAPEPELAHPSTFLVRLDVGVDRDRAMARLQREFAGTMFSPRPHADVRNLQRVADLPALLGALVVLVALGTVAHAVVTSVRRRRRDLAVLKALGLVRGQVAATIAWQATTFAVVALGLGVPLGIAVGRWAWQLPQRSEWPRGRSSRSWPWGPSPSAWSWLSTWSLPSRAGPRAGCGRPPRCARSNNSRQLSHLSEASAERQFRRLVLSVHPVILNAVCAAQVGGRVQSAPESIW
jgi:hypothetical protein